MKDFLVMILWLILMYFPEWSLVAVLLIFSEMKHKKRRWLLLILYGILFAAYWIFFGLS